MRSAAKMLKPYALRQRPSRPAWLDYPYPSDQLGHTFWDDHKHQIWPLIVGAVLTFGGYTIIAAIRHFTLLDTLC